jgi:hypothetical protein
MKNNYYSLVECVSGLNDTEKNKLQNYFESSITYINSKYKNEEMYKKQLVVWMIKNLYKSIRYDQIESFVDDWFKRANLNTDEMTELKNSYYYYSHDNDLYLGLAEKIIQEKNNESGGLMKNILTLFTF